MEKSQERKRIGKRKSTANREHEDSVNREHGDDANRRHEEAATLNNACMRLPILPASMRPISVVSTASSYEYQGQAREDQNAEADAGDEKARYRFPYQWDFESCAGVLAAANREFYGGIVNARNTARPQYRPVYGLADSIVVMREHVPVRVLYAKSYDARIVHARAFLLRVNNESSITSKIVCLERQRIDRFYF